MRDSKHLPLAHGQKYSEKNSVLEIDFVKPAYKTDVIEFGFEVTKIGKTSLVLKSCVRNFFTKDNIIVVDKIVMVCVDANNNSVPHGISED